MTNEMPVLSGRDVIDVRTPPPIARRRAVDTTAPNYDFTRHVHGVILIDYLCHAG